MTQPVDLNVMAMRPVYNAVNIKIKKPEVNASNSGEDLSFVTDTGIYNAVKINIDNPSVNKEPKKQIYDYPEAKDVVTYDMAQVAPIEVPAANYTTLEAEKELKASPEGEEKKNKSLTFHGTETNLKKPEIIPGEEIFPEVDVAKIVNKLNSDDYDTQALQMEEIVRKSAKDSKDAIPYLVKDIFTSLIDIAQKDTTKLEAPTKEQIEIRQKLIVNYITTQKNPNKKEVPFKLSDEEIALANKITPMEQAERNKEYAIYTMAVLSKVYVDEIKKETGNIVPMTDVPGMSTIVDTLKTSKNPGVKIAAIDALKYQQRPEYEKEMKAIYEAAKSDRNPQVAIIAARAAA